ncbi:MAG: Hpt domain-containing protein [Bdellovibrionaceae bacterium]|jgi:HPt (histidine-containing phosphotransfer) domain-containing protein|nr:Hpt domain-containing protein [Pseudobdellovibrionaceae bacterium]
MEKELDIELMESYEDNNLIMFLVNNFKDNVPIEINKLIMNVKQNNEKESLRVAHKLKNLFLNVGSHQSAELCQEIEDNYKTINKDTVENLEHLLYYEYKSTQKTLNHYLDSRT